jgi:cytochrome c-type biogenesis protein CcmH
MGVLLVTAFTISTRHDSRPETTQARVKRVASEVRCPTCRQLSAAESDAPAAEAVRVAITKRVEQGQSDAQIRAFLVGSYGKDILLKPGGSGVAGLVWAVPVAAFVCALAGLAFAFLRWRRAGADPTADDRLLVEQALARMPPAAGSGDRASAAGSGDRASAAGSGDRASAAGSGDRAG